LAQPAADHLGGHLCTIVAANVLRNGRVNYFWQLQQQTGIGGAVASSSGMIQRAIGAKFGCLPRQG
jgi:hypothetical protein